MPERPKQLAHLDYLGDATKFSGQIHALIPKCNLLEKFSHAEVRLLSHFMDVYMCEAGTEIIREGEDGDFLPQTRFHERYASFALRGLGDERCESFAVGVRPGD